MKQGRGKGKGNAFEWATCRQLSLWMSGGEDKTQLIPSRSSGGWAGKKGTESWRHVGDLAPNGPLGDRFRSVLAIECKHYRTIDFWHYWTAGPGENLRGWWKKLNDEIERDHHDRGAHGPRLEPLLIFRANNRPVMAAGRLWLIGETKHMSLPDIGCGVARLDDVLECWSLDQIEEIYTKPLTFTSG